jgi:hypothetical protein
MEIKNGATVHRIWKTLPDAELIAVFQYINHAETYCKAALGELPEGTFLAAVCHYSGKMTLFHPEKAKEGDTP